MYLTFDADRSGRWRKYESDFITDMDLRKMKNQRHIDRVYYEDDMGEDSNGNTLNTYENFTRALIRGHRTGDMDRCDGRYRRVFHELF